MSDYYLDRRPQRSHQRTPAPSEFHGGSSIGDPQPRIPAYNNWTEASNPPPQAFSPGRDDSQIGVQERAFNPARDESRVGVQDRAFRPPPRRVDHSLRTPRQSQAHGPLPIDSRDFRVTPSDNALPQASRSYVAPFSYQHEHPNPPHYHKPPSTTATRHYEEPSPVPDPAYAWEEFIILRRQVHKLQDKLTQMEELVTDLKQSRFNVPSRLTPSLGPSDSISRVASGIDADGCDEELRAAYEVYLGQDALLEKPARLPDSVLWTFKSAQDLGAIAGFSKKNSYRPSFKKALRDSKGNTLDLGVVKLIKRTSNNLADRILALHPIDKVQVDAKHIREYYQSKCPILWYGSIILLEERHRESVMNARQKVVAMSKKQSTGEAGSTLDSDDKQQSADDPFATPKKLKRTANTFTPLKPGPSKRSRAGSNQKGPRKPIDDHAKQMSKAAAASIPSMQIDPPSSPPREDSTISTVDQFSPKMTAASVSTLPPPSLFDSPPTSHVSSSHQASLSMITTDDGFENLRRTLQSPQFRFADGVINPAMDLLAAMEQSPTHGGHGFPSSDTIALLKRVQTADPACIEDEEDLGQCWGHWQWTSGSLTIGSVITSWQSVGNTEIARQLIAAALTTCKAARYLCMAITPKPQSYLSDSYLDRIVSTLSEVWKRSGGPIYKCKARATNVEPAEPVATGEGSHGLDAIDPLVEGGETHPAADDLENPQEDNNSALQSKVEELHLPELRSLAARKQITGSRTMNKATCISSLLALAKSNRPSIADLDEILAKRPPKKTKVSKSTKPTIVDHSPASLPGASNSTGMSEDSMQAPRIIANAACFHP